MTSLIILSVDKLREKARLLRRIISLRARNGPG
jgi:hypothetical protein